jgi:hypothetical protein
MLTYLPLMGNDSGRGYRSDEPPQLGTVRRLHLDDVGGSNATTTEAWYETERLTGHIIGGVRSPPPIDPSASAPSPEPHDSPVLLDWRHAAPVAAPTVLERLGQTLAARRYRRRRRGTQDAEASSARARGEAQRAAFAAASQIEPPKVAPHEDEPGAEKIRAAEPIDERLGLRESADRAPDRPKRWFAPSTNHREHGRRPQLRRLAIASAVALSVVATAVTAIVYRLNNSVAKPHKASLVSSTSTPAAGFSTTASTVVAAARRLERRVPASPARHRPVRTQRQQRPQHRRTTVPRARPVTHAAVTVRHAPVYTTPTRTTPVYTAPVRTPSASVPTPATASRSTSPAVSSPRPALGEFGTLGPGRSPDS